MIRIEKIILKLAERANWVSGISIVLMMMLTVLDVILRFFRIPIPGTYEMVGLFGALAISFALGYTSMEKGHIAVDFLVQKFPEKAKNFIGVFNNLVACTFFALASWYSFLCAAGFKDTNQVTSTLQVPKWPFVTGIGIGCIILCLVLLVEILRTLRGATVE